jgi:hypothetical protein
VGDARVVDQPVDELVLALHPPRQIAPVLRARDVEPAIMDRTGGVLRWVERLRWLVGHVGCDDGRALTDEGFGLRGACPRRSRRRSSPLAPYARSLLWAADLTQGMDKGETPSTTLFSMFPIPSTVILTTSPPTSGEGSMRPFIPYISARAPKPQALVPEVLAVDGHFHVQVEAVVVVVTLQLVRGHDPRSQSVSEDLALGRSQSDLHLVPLDVADGPVVQDSVAGDVLPRLFWSQVVAGLADYCGDLQLEVKRLVPGRHRHRVVGADHGVGVAEVEGGDLVLCLRNARTSRDALGDPLDVFFEDQEVPQGGCTGARRRTSSSGSGGS